MLKRALLVIPSLAFLFISIGYSQEFISLLAESTVYFTHAGIYMTVGFMAYFPLHFMFRKYIIFHIFGHELTHALWAMIFGGRVEEFYASQRAGGFVTYTKENFLILLAPYFFPLYAIVFTLLFHVSKSPYTQIFLFLMGFSLSFHLMLTMWSIRIGQSDIRRTGVFFSLIFIYLMNVLVYGMLICSVHSDHTIVDFLHNGFTRILYNLNIARALL